MGDNIAARGGATIGDQFYSCPLFEDAPPRPAFGQGIAADLDKRKQVVEQGEGEKGTLCGMPADFSGSSATRCEPGRPAISAARLVSDVGSPGREEKRRMLKDKTSAFRSAYKRRNKTTASATRRHAANARHPRETGANWRPDSDKQCPARRGARKLRPKSVGS